MLFYSLYVQLLSFSFTVICAVYFVYLFSSSFTVLCVDCVFTVCCHLAYQINK